MCLEQHQQLPFSSDHLWHADIHGIPTGPCLHCGEDAYAYHVRVQAEIAPLLPAWYREQAEAIK